jgi:hypothetical protein
MNIDQFILILEEVVSDLRKYQDKQHGSKAAAKRARVNLNIVKKEITNIKKQTME